MVVEVHDVSKDFRAAPEPVHALQNIEFRAYQGESVAVVGKNGAGKSTLLRILAGIQSPTTGYVRRPLRCSSLIDLGMTFHPELTGRENLYLGLTLAGFRQQQIRKLEHSVLEFAGIGGNLPQQVKHYSSGMVARLASAIAVHSRPELLLVDEVLAVGDNAFQHQMLARVEQLVHNGTILLLVTHSSALAAAATGRTVWLEDGCLVADGPTADVLPAYEAASLGWKLSSEPRVVNVSRLTVEPQRIEVGAPVVVRADLTASCDVEHVRVRVELRPAIGTAAPWMRDPDGPVERRHLNLLAETTSTRLKILSTGINEVLVEIESIPVTETLLELSLQVLNNKGDILDQADCELEIGRSLGRPFYHLRAEIS